MTIGTVQERGKKGAGKKYKECHTDARALHKHENLKTIIIFINSVFQMESLTHHNLHTSAQELRP